MPAARRARARAVERVGERQLAVARDGLAHLRQRLRVTVWMSVELARRPLGVVLDAAARPARS